MNNKTKPLVSVIIPTHMRASILSRAVDSVLAQTYKDFEVIVVSDGIDEPTDLVIQKYNDDRIVYIRREIAGGASAARNDGIRRSNGNYIAFLDDDDEWTSDKLEVQMPVIEKSADNVGLIYAWMDYWLDGQLIKIHKPTVTGDVFEGMLDGQIVGGCPSIIVKRFVFDKVGLFDETLKRGNDGDMWRRISKYYYVDCVPKIIAHVYTDNNDRISSCTKKSLQNALYAYEQRLVKFETDFKKYPERHLNVLATIVELAIGTGQILKAYKYMKTALYLEKRFLNRSMLFKRVLIYGIYNKVNILLTEYKMNKKHRK